MTLTEFLLARIAEDDERAKRAAFGWGREWTTETDSAEDWSAVHADGKRDMVGCEDGDVTEHIARHDPARVLADCERDRQIVELHSSDHECTAPGDGYAGVFAADGTMPSACSTMRLLALPYADHPDYREEWAQ